MRITCLSENTSLKGLPTEHGLSLHIAPQQGSPLLFDMGQSDLFTHNAAQLGIDLQDVAHAIISHGHYDHGGGLPHFLKMNQKAKVWVQTKAFEPHYSIRGENIHFIGLNPEFSNHPQIATNPNTTSVALNHWLFTCPEPHRFKALGRLRMKGPTVSTTDNFEHEQSLLIQENDNFVLFAGCAHTGLMNIIQQAKAICGHTPTHVFAGMHLTKSELTPSEQNEYLRYLAQLISQYQNMQIWTMHCTGIENFNILKTLLGDQIHYLSCGDEVVV